MKTKTLDEERDVNEPGTVTIITDMLEEVFGSDLIEIDHQKDMIDDYYEYRQSVNRYAVEALLLTETEKAACT